MPEVVSRVFIRQSDMLKLGHAVENAVRRLRDESGLLLGEAAKWYVPGEFYCEDYRPSMAAVISEALGYPVSVVELEDDPKPREGQ